VTTIWSVRAVSERDLCMHFAALFFLFFRRLREHGLEACHYGLGFEYSFAQTGKYCFDDLCIQR
jgi:hypothetical protein